MKRINDAILQLGYQPNRVARSLKGSSSGIVGMIVPSLSDMFFSKCAEAVENVAKKHGALLVLVASHDQDKTVASSFQQLLQHHIDGLILVSSELKDAGLIRMLRSSRVPIVGVDRPLKKVRCPSLLCENFLGAQIATEHLLEHGYHKILSIQVKPDLFTMQERVRGYRAAMAAARRKPCEEVICNCEDAVRLLSRLSKGGGEAIGLFAGNNLTARYLCEAMQILQVSIPEQFAILSFDDFDLADTLRPPMSVVRQPVEELGRAAAELLFEQMPAWKNRERSPAPMQIQLAPRLVIRESCGCHAQK